MGWLSPVTAAHLLPIHTGFHASHRLRLAVVQEPLESWLNLPTVCKGKIESLNNLIQTKLCCTAAFMQALRKMWVSVAGGIAGGMSGVIDIPCLFERLNEYYKTGRYCPNMLMSLHGWPGHRRKEWRVSVLGGRAAECKRLGCLRRERRGRRWPEGCWPPCKPLMHGSTRKWRLK